MHLPLYFLGVAVGVVILAKSADWFTDAGVSIARRLNVPEIIIGATLVSLATTLPEFSVSVTAALAHQVEMAVGNAVGSTICNIVLILGLCTVLAPMGVERRDSAQRVWTAVLCLLFVSWGFPSTLDGCRAPCVPCPLLRHDPALDQRSAREHRRRGPDRPRTGVSDHAREDSRRVKG